MAETKEPADAAPIIVIERAVEPHEHHAKIIREQTVLSLI